MHTGEREIRGDDIVGIGVHIGARVGPLVGPNDVLVSSTLRDLAIGSGLEFDDRGAHQLKGGSGSERWWLILFGDVGVVESSFGRNGFGGVVGAGVSASRHHHTAVCGGLDDWWFAGP